VSKDERRAILLHEWEHCRQGDTWGQVCIDLIGAFFWWNPLYFKLKREVLQLNELVADNAAATQMGSVKHYASLLIQMKERALASSYNNYIMAFAKSLLSVRVHHLVLNTKQPPRKRQYLYVVGTALFLATTALWIKPALEATTTVLLEYEWQQSQDAQTNENCLTCGGKR